MDQNLVYEKVYPKILKYLSLQPRTEKEILDKLRYYLKKLDVTDETANDLGRLILEDFRQANFVNDRQYAIDFAEVISRSSKQRGTQYIKRFLLKKGINIGIIESVLAAYSMEVDKNNAMAAADKKIKTLKAKNPYDAKQKLWRYLQSRGFPSDVIGYVLEAKLGVK